jgi:hypothetical protein
MLSANVGTDPFLTPFLVVSWATLRAPQALMAHERNGH